MKIVPEYGYQVTSFGINGQDIVTGDNISEFTFPISKGNFHLGAEVTKVDNIVKANAQNVENGNITISDDEIDSGSVRLSVNDVELSSDKIAGFESKAGDYTISSYLDIDLDQIIYKGNEDDVWSKRIHELDNEATITLKLADGVNADEIVIVHNINDGDEYEIIEIESYDKETNTITFKTKSFSNYVIATKTTTDTTTGTETKTSTSPSTGDSIMMTLTIFGVAVIGLGLTSMIKKSNKKYRKH